MSIPRNQWEFIKSPSLYIERISTETQAALIGFKNVLFIALLYEGAILLWAFGADYVTIPAFLRIPEETYYYYELLFLIPIFIFTWLLSSSIAYVLSKAIGGKGSYDALLAGFGLTMAISAYFTLIPDYIQGILWTTNLIPFSEYQNITSRGILLIVVWIYMLAYTISHIVFYSFSVYYTQHLSRFKSIFVGVVSYMGSFAVWITFIR